MAYTFEELEDKVLDWGHEKGILSSSTALKQIEKTLEELIETRDALVELNVLDKLGLPNDHPVRKEAEFKVVDGIGDMKVTIILLAELKKLDCVECLDVAYEEIKGRTGNMVDGIFVKDE